VLRQYGERESFGGQAADRTCKFWVNARMAESSASSIAIYQLRVVLCGVSPLVWRRLLVISETSLAELHEILQNAFDWSGEHLHRFLIHGAAYGVPLYWLNSNKDTKSDMGFGVIPFRDWVFGLRSTPKIAPRLVHQLWEPNSHAVPQLFFREIVLTEQV
jgi:hypothetical protein